MKMVRQYESPLTMRTQVQLEKGFMKASVTVKNDKENGRVEEHQVNQDFGYTLDAGNEWSKQ
ncbi:MAG: hypothetical protein SPF66_05945 [Bacteroidaceae bacterium]|nr:hypothetical protein [Prevotellaceae bacterium]MDY5599217.1 hypothetical protein [Bacteroidaceae bacterium]